MGGVGAPQHRFGWPAAALLVAAMIVGSALVWIGIPLGCMWLAGQLTDNFGAHMPMALAMILPAVLVGTLGLGWLNNLYLRVTGDEGEGSRSWRVRRRGPLEPILIGCFVLGLVALLAWFFFFAENPPRDVIP